MSAVPAVLHRIACHFRVRCFLDLGYYQQHRQQLRPPCTATALCCREADITKIKQTMIPWHLLLDGPTLRDAQYYDKLKRRFENKQHSPTNSELSTSPQETAASCMHPRIIPANPRACATEILCLIRVLASTDALYHCQTARATFAPGTSLCKIAQVSFWKCFTFTKNLSSSCNSLSARNGRDSVNNNVRVYSWHILVSRQ